jgi:hypothetical protein
VKSITTFLVVNLVVSGIGRAQQPDPVGAEFQVNSYTTGRQAIPAVATFIQGGFVVTWESYGSYESDVGINSRSIQSQRYDGTGAPLGDQFQVNSFTTGIQWRSAVAADAEGRFVVTWQSDGSYESDDSNWSIQGQRYDATGAPTGGQFQVNSYTSSNQTRPAVAQGAAGNFVMVWDSDGGYGDDTSFSSIQAQRYDVNGTQLGGQFQVNSYTSGFQSEASVAAAADGDFVVVWSSYGSYGNDTSNRSVQAQRYDVNGARLGGQFQVNSYTTSYQAYAAVAADADGNFMVVWKSEGSYETDTAAGSIQGQSYDANGVPVGAQFQVNTYTTNNQESPKVAADAFGNFVVVWYSFSGDGTDSDSASIQGQRYSANGSPIGGQFQINTYTTSSQRWPAVAMGTEIVVVWDSIGSNGTDSSNASVQGQRYDSGVILVDGFESGDTSAWTDSVP